ncbi:hypothetical protein Tco_1375841 [Tanacetum coccineum]
MDVQKKKQSMEVDDVGGCTRMILDILEAHDDQAPSLYSEPLEEQAPNSYAKEYYDMLEADDEPLYEGCQKYSTLEAATRKVDSFLSRCKVCGHSHYKNGGRNNGEKSSNPHGDPRSPLGTGMGMENDSLTGMGTGMRMRLINGDGDGKYDP